MKSAAPVYRKHLFLHLCIITVAVVIAYSNVFRASFMAWDDAEYVLNNPDIRVINASTIKAWFTRFYVGNYQPLTMFSYAIDYAIGGVKPFMYHFSGILLHIANACLVYAFFSKLQQQKTVALAVALFFALHPSQAESISWVAERKTALCGFFYLLAMLQYQGYMRNPVAGRMLLLLLFAAGAMLSKGVAATLPLALLATDLWLERDLRDRSVWTEKIPLFLMALGTGIIAISAQRSGQFMAADTHTIIEKIVFAGYAYTQYIVRFFVPIGLAAMYPYPTEIGAVHVLFFAATIGIAVLFFMSLRKNWNMLSGGILFYTANIILLLQFIPFGKALMADRYMYISCIGLAYPAMHYLAAWLRKLQMGKRLMFIGGPAVGALLVLCLMRNEVWRSDENFYTALLKRFPESAETHYSMGEMYMRKGDYEQAELHIDKAVRLEPSNSKAWYNKGIMHMRKAQAMQALEAFDKSISINNYPKAHFSRAMLHMSSGRHDLALADVEAVLLNQPTNARALCIKGDCLERMGRLQEALEQYNKALELDTREPLFYVRRGATLCKLKQFAPAIADLNASLEMDASNGEALYWRGIARHETGQDACRDLRNALQRRYAPAQQALEQWCR